jgi:RNA recognition motif-containing protein
VQSGSVEVIKYTRKGVRMPYKIRIGGLSATVTEPLLESMFSPFGTVLSTELVDEPQSDADSDVHGFPQTIAGIVTFAEDAAGERAVHEMNGFVIDGKALTVGPYSLRPPPPRLPPNPPPPI